jgi:hypothetical protein
MRARGLVLKPPPLASSCALNFGGFAKT